jgi:hypothetical protein
MRRKLVGLAVTALLITTAAHPAAAQARGYIGFGAGVSIPVGSFADNYKLGWLGQVIAGVTGANGTIGGRIDGMYAANKLKGATGTTYSSTTLKLLGVNADLVWTPGQRPAKVHPYLLGGLGFYNSKGGSVGETKLAFNLGGGLQIHSGNRMSVFTEARFISIQHKGGSTSFIPISVGLRWGGI